MVTYLGVGGVILTALAYLAYVEAPGQPMMLWLVSGSACLLSLMAAQVIGTSRYDGDSVEPAFVGAGAGATGWLGTSTAGRVDADSRWDRALRAPLAFGLRSGTPMLRLSRVPVAREDAGRDMAVQALRVANQALAEEVAQRQATVDSLRESERRYREVVDSLPDMVAVVARGRVVFVNSTGARLAGFASAQAMNGMRLADLVQPAAEDPIGRFAEPDDAPDEGAPVRGRLVRADGAVLDVEYSCARLRFHDEDARQFIVRDISRRVRAETIMRQMAFHDTLTGLPNRALFMDRLSRALSQARRDRVPVAVAFVDLDGFKKINDTLGHDAGDAVLTEVADRLSKRLRDEDTVARHGGDEFTVVARLSAESDAEALAERLLDALESEIAVCGQSVRVGASVGVAVYPHDGDDEVALLRVADAAMYSSKARTGSAYQVGGNDPKGVKRQDSDRWGFLYSAMASGDLVLRYSPLFDVEAARFVGMEALPYWKHPGRGWIELLTSVNTEVSRAIPRPILDWFVSSACADAHIWEMHGLEFGRIMLRLNAAQFDQPDAVARIFSVLERTQLSARLLEIVVAETAAVREPDILCDTLGALVERGVRVSIDGLGETSASAVCMDAFRVEAFRISRDLIAGIGCESGASTVVETLIDLTRDIGVDVVADGVENARQLDFLRARGCRLIQGGLVGGTLSAAGAATVLSTAPQFAVGKRMGAACEA